LEKYPYIRRNKMDPITTAIVAALTIGVTTGVTKFGESVIVDARVLTLREKAR
jgi:hypothetical protein